MTGAQRAGLVLRELDPAVAANVLRHVDERVVEDIVRGMLSAPPPEPEERSEVLVQAAALLEAVDASGAGLLDRTWEILEQAFGQHRARELWQRVVGEHARRPFGSLADADPNQIAALLQQEPPQVVALVLCHLDPSVAARVLSGLPVETRAEVVERMGRMDRAAPEVVEIVERLMERRLTGGVRREHVEVGGIDAVVRVLNQVGRSAERAILEELSHRDAELAERIRERLFTFDDLARLDSRTIQRILREVDIQRDLPLALKGVRQELAEIVLSNISERARAIVLEAMESMGPVRLSEVEAAQQRIVAIARRLEDQGEIVLSKGEVLV